LTARIYFFATQKIFLALVYEKDYENSPASRGGIKNFSCNSLAQVFSSPLPDQAMDNNGIWWAQVNGWYPAWPV
jgi:hypothetical protein